MDDEALETETEDGVADEGDEQDEGFLALLQFLHKNRGFDFTGYKQTSLKRRVRRRMQAVGVDSFAAYLDHLEVHPHEFPQLFNMLLINVTSFFRDAAAWQVMKERLPTIVDIDSDDPIRVWSAGCSTGEEPYTLAMVLCEVLGPEAFAHRVKIYATDIDDDALGIARQATYTAKAVAGIPEELLPRYFTANGGAYTFQKEFRRAVIFGRHDLVQDAPIPRVDILTCRNALMYFNTETQTRILNRLQFALNPKGLLFLGKAEMLLTHADLFTPVDLKLRLFARASKSLRLRERLGADVAGASATITADDRNQVRRAAFEATPVAQVVVDPTGKIVMTNARARQMFGVTSADVGRGFHEIELSYRPAELRSCIDKVRVDRRAVQLKEVERELSSGEKSFLDIDVLPLVSEHGSFLGTQVSFTDVTQAHRLQAELRRTNAELESAHEELQSTSEELETTNEELQSTVEELETTNEELQSTNEELETMNEELQSTNEELQTINEELRQRGTELNDVNTFYSGVLGSLRVGVAVLDRDLLIRAWNRKMQDLWGLRADEVEQRHFVNLDIGLPVAELTAPLRASLATLDSTELVKRCTNRLGKTIDCKIAIVPMKDDGDASSRGVLVFVEERP